MNYQLILLDKTTHLSDEPILFEITAKSNFLSSDLPIVILCNFCICLYFDLRVFTLSLCHSYPTRKYCFSLCTFLLLQIQTSNNKFTL